MAGHQLANAAEQRAVAVGVSESQNLGKRFVVQFRRNGRMLEQRLDLGGKRKQPAVPVVVEGLDAQAIARAKQAAPLSIPDGEGEHATEQVETTGAMLFVSMQDGFGVRARLVTIARSFQRRAQLGVVVDLAVVSDPDRPGLVGHGLAAALRVDDAEAAMAQMGPVVMIEAEIVRTAMSKGLGHATEVHHAAGNRRRGDQPGHPAHLAFSVRFSCRRAPVTIGDGRLSCSLRSVALRLARRSGFYSWWRRAARWRRRNLPGARNCASTRMNSAKK